MTGTTSCAIARPPVPSHASTLVRPASRIAAARFSRGEPKLTPLTVTGAPRSNALAELLTKKLRRHAEVCVARRFLEEEAQPPGGFVEGEEKGAAPPAVGEVLGDAGAEAAVH